MNQSMRQTIGTTLQESLIILLNNKTRMMDNNNHYYTECTYEHICKVNEGVTSIEDWGLADEIELTKIVFPSTLTELGDQCYLCL